MSDKLLATDQEKGDKLQALLSNTNVARIISSTVEGTIGPRGLDIMMVDRFGDVVVTNDGVTILKFMEVSHPVAHMIINAARAQQEEIGDGTTTATIIASALVVEGAAQVLKGVPVTRVVEGINIGIRATLENIEANRILINSLDDERLVNIAAVAGRGENDLAELVVEGARLVGKDRLLDPDYKYADAVIAREGTENRVFKGVVVNKQPVNKEMPTAIQGVVILAVDDALRPEDLDREAMKTEAGFQYYLQARQQYEDNLIHLIGLGVNLIVVDRNIDSIAEEILTEAGIMVLQRVSSREMEKLCQHTGARKIKISALNRPAEVLKKYLGYAEVVKFDEKLKQTYIYGGKGQNLATLILGASTGEVVDERERIARDAASAVQAALQGGVVPGGGALEVWLASQLEEKAREAGGMSSYGILAVREALLKPFTCMASNSGFNPLEKLGNIIAAQKKEGKSSITFDSDSGEIIDVLEKAIFDPVLVKLKAIKTAGEVATSILRINTVIKMKNDESGSENIDITE
ncbi:MAG: TCP-1/cpn60 chaperonin family protein [Syntrophomonadaceae bacterium]|jgi:chaperonin GroEL (HSP60 family)